MAKSELAVDVLILGAGPAGCATALALLAAGVGKVLLVHRPLAVPFAIGESATPDVGPLLARLGIDHNLCRLGHLAWYGSLSLWSGHRPAFDPFLSRGWDHGWHLDRGRFDAWLRAQAVARGARLVGPASLAGIVPSANGWRVRLNRGADIIARVVVDAAGSRAPLARRLGARRHQIDAMVALAVRLPNAPSQRFAGLSVVEACADGWWYAAPLPGGGAVVMLATDRDIAEARRFRDPQIFVGAWRQTRELARLAPPLAAAAPVAVFPASSSFVDRAAGPGWIAVGDALISFDPLASSGIAGALGDALRAVAVIVAELGSGTAGEAARAYGRTADATLKRYWRERGDRYAAVCRWSGSPFWSRRTSVAAARTAGPFVSSPAA